MFKITRKINAAIKKLSLKSRCEVIKVCIRVVTTGEGEIGAVKKLEEKLTVTGDWRDVR